MTAEAKPDVVRRRVVAGGALLVLTSLPLAFAASELFYTLRPAQVWGDRITVLIPFLPLSAFTIVVAGILWTRRTRPSLKETVLALVPVELLASALVLLAYQPIAADAILIWVLANALFLPWWFLGAWVARLTADSFVE